MLMAGKRQKKKNYWRHIIHTQSQAPRICRHTHAQHTYIHTYTHTHTRAHISRSCCDRRPELLVSAVTNDVTYHVRNNWSLSSLGAFFDPVFARTPVIRQCPRTFVADGFDAPPPRPPPPPSPSRRLLCLPHQTGSPPVYYIIMSVWMRVAFDNVCVLCSMLMLACHTIRLLRRSRCCRRFCHAFRNRARKNAVHRVFRF